MKMMFPVVLCRPEGGLNDMLCQIEKCWQYAEKNQKQLVVDTKKTCLAGELINFFTPKENGMLPPIFEAAEVLDKLNSAQSTVPPGVAGRLLTYTASYERSVRNFIDKDAGFQLSFDFEQTYDSELLLHHQCGGGKESYKFLERVVLSEPVRNKIAEKRALATFPYDAIHVRNTDYLTDYESFFESLENTLTGKNVLICSDNAKVILRAKQKFQDVNVFSLSDIPDYNGAPLHDRWVGLKKTAEEKTSNAYNMIVDLVLMGLSEKVHFTKTVGGNVSGFSRLADFLSAHKGLLSQLLCD